ncbi:hypothetical protein MKX03_021716 [Papaver bracteatum]|nr:hypothetical protein MKX03_021716 [Papaver bracteatum]
MELPMDCNRDEAIRAKGLAERKMNSQDYAGARKMALRAQKLYPSIENITRMLTVCEVHCSAKFKINDGKDLDWYGILQIEQTANDKTIKQQYRKLALQLHPDKNKFPGAEGAFKLISDAQMFLSDQTKRQGFDHRRKSMSSGQQMPAEPQPIRNNYKQAGSSSNHASTSTAAQFTSMNARQQNQHQTQPVFGNGQQTFWTACPFCNSRNLSYREKMNKAIRCQSCRQPFIPYELNNAAPVSQPPIKTGRAYVVGGAPKPKGKGVNVHAEAATERKGIPAEPEQSGTKNRKRGRNPELEEDSVRRDSGSSFTVEKDGDHKAGQNSGLNSGRVTRTSRRKHDVSCKENVSHDNDLPIGSRRKTTKLDDLGVKVEKYEKKAPLERTPGCNAGKGKKTGEEVTADGDSYEGPGKVDVEVPDPDFCDFDKDRSENCFAVDQMWAIFDDLDGMPRFYARIKKVYSPFKVGITWLDFVAGDLDETAWRRSGLPVACGKFKHEKNDTIEDICIFSHRIVWEKGVKNSYMIYPRKGETWALYKNWNINWSSDLNNRREYEYEFVVVLSDYSKTSGILVARLVKLKGFVCLFKPTINNGTTSFQIPSNEILKFSHRVPSFRTNGQERAGVPEGYFELDPASIPTNLPEVSDFIDVEAGIAEDGKTNGSFNYVSEEKPHQPKKRKNLDEKSTLNESSPGRTRSSSKMSNGYYKNANEEPVEKCVSETFSAPDGVTAKTERVSEQVTSLTVGPCVLPQSEIYGFEVDKTRDKFQAGQVWALYCELDGLPKYYAQIKKVEPTPEFKLNIQWLEACSPPKGVLRWRDNSKMPTCCGVFSSGEKTEFNDTATFSHLSKGAAAVKRNRYEIYPRKGEVWAIYRNFSLKWSSSDLQTCQYDIGEVAEVDGAMKVLVLEKVSDYKTVFKGQRKSGHESIVEIPRHELLRFSHQIPAIQLTDEKEGTLRGCWELDPKAIPVSYFNSKF